jgi:hypothetical protein
MDNLQFQKVTIYAGFDPSRYAFYMDGLSSVFPKRNLILSSQVFPRFHQHCLPLIIGDDPGVKIYLSTGDGPGYNEDGLLWSDLYVKRTLLKEKVPETFASKIVPGGPHMETRAWGLIETFMRALQTYKATDGNNTGLAIHLRRYLQQYFFRLPEENYEPGEVRPNYVFYAATLYPTHPNYNRSRATFIEACRMTPDVEFEGGLIRKDNFRVDEYKHITISKYYRPRIWLKNVKSSLLGFWAPGDQGAMTLKLGEFMACGKAIIAMPIRQEMLPSPLRHGEHVHFVDGTLEQMKTAVQLLITDDKYRQRLECNARAYYEKWVAPAQAIRRFIREAFRRLAIDVGQA